VGLIVHAAADTTFSRPLDRARVVNTVGTAHVVELASACQRLERLTYVSSAYVAGCAVGRVTERDNGSALGWVNAYEQSKYEAETHIRGSELPWVIARPSTIVCQDSAGHVPQINAVHRALRVYHRGLAAMIPGDPGNHLDVITASYVAGAIARLTLDPRAIGCTVHLCSGRSAPTLGQVLDDAYEVWAEDVAWKKRGVARVMITDADTYRLFERAVIETGDARLGAVLSSLSHFIPHLALPKVFDTATADSLLDDRPPDPRSYWKPMLRRLLADNWCQTAEAAA
jgi:nucleoside-diphosphate-sugar epimerase